MPRTETSLRTLPPEAARDRCIAIRTRLQSAGLFGMTASWRVSPCPFYLSSDQLQFFINLGPQLLSFYRALNRLYNESAKAFSRLGLPDTSIEANRTPWCSTAG